MRGKDVSLFSDPRATLPPLKEPSTVAAIVHMLRNVRCGSLAGLMPKHGMTLSDLIDAMLRSPIKNRRCPACRAHGTKHLREPDRRDEQDRHQIHDITLRIQHGRTLLNHFGVRNKSFYVALLRSILALAVGIYHCLIDSAFFSRERKCARNEFRFAILIGWIAAVALQVARHVMWRDEVRALSIALNGDNLIAMLRGLHGEGHPALWYVLLRASHGLIGTVAVLPGMAFVIALAMVTILIFRSPFPRAFIVVLITSHWSLYEYVVMARNYGISALLLFTMATCYPSWRDRGLLLGLLLFLLANTNVIGTLMVAAFLLFWFVDVVEETGPRWSPQLGTLLLNGLIATIGVVACGLTILPTYNDAATYDWSASSPLYAAIESIIHPGSTSLNKLFPDCLPGVVQSALLFGSTAGLLRRRAALLAALSGLLLTSLFLGLAAHGGYRHSAVWLCFVIALYWISWDDVSKANAPSAKPWRILAHSGQAALLLLLGAQLLLGLNNFYRELRHQIPQSRSADLGRLIAARPDLEKAVVVVEPDFMAETLSYYMLNPTYLIRAHQYGNVGKYPRSGQLDTDLGEILRISRELQRTTCAPIVILLSHRLENVSPDKIYSEGYNWTFHTSAEQMRDFKRATTMICRFEPAQTDESFDVYLLPLFEQHTTKESVNRCRYDRAE